VSDAPTLLTIGHSNRSTGELLALLAEAGVELLVDVRRYPGSRRHPHFRREALEQSLTDAGIAYEHRPELGGHREPAKSSPNSAIDEPALRGYADHMAKPAFRSALVRLIDHARGRTTAAMCAEASPDRCHRRLLSDQLDAEGVRVLHLLGTGEPSPHRGDPRAEPGPSGALVWRRAEQGSLFD
jgi:uncharacterized protein (DUF488 family)